MAKTPRKANTRGRAGESTRQMQFGRLATVLAILLLMWLALYLYSRNTKTIMSLGLTGSLIVGSIFLFGLKLLEKKGTTTLKRAKQAERGAIAEEKTGAFLEGLPEGNFIIHDFDTGHGNIDHILVGPKGIFTLEVKSHRGTVTFENGNLLREGKPFEKDFLKQAWAECFALRKTLSQRGITEPKAEPVILFTNAFVKVRGRAKGIEIATIDYFRRQLPQLPDRLSPVEAERIFERLKAPQKTV